MKLTILTDNTVLPSKNFLGEHGLSFYIEDGDKKILFDTGYSDVFLKNAFKMGIDLLDLDYIVLSHGHYDHTWGLSHYLSFYESAIKQGKIPKKTTILTHSHTFYEKFHEKHGEIGCQLTEEKLSKNFNLELTKTPVEITENITFLGEIPRKNDFEGKEFIGKVRKKEGLVEDYITEDSAMVYTSEKGIAVITGCSHSGICNIVEYARLITGVSSVIDIIGGFHLAHPSQERITKTVDYLSKLNLNGIHSCHCTDFYATMALARHIKLKATGVGLIREY